MITILTGDCRDVLAGLPEASMDAVVTDPPYHLTAGTGSTGFMSQEWDGGDVAFRPETWAAVLRVLKPGAHMIAFGGTRTYHRLACAIEDAGFEIRDQIGWVYGSGFPKSLDVAKAIDKAAGAEREVLGPSPFASRKPNGTWTGGVYGDEPSGGDGPTLTATATPEAAAWQGWGTALKPAWEPICLARKPLVGTVAANVTMHGTGVINIDGCRIECEPQAAHELGRWPANLIHDGSDEVSACFPESAGSGPARTLKRGVRDDGDGWGMQDAPGLLRDAGTGSAARFFYCAKASKSERGAGNTHPTVKPLALMRYLVRLITPQGGHVLDPFAGSGTTGVAAAVEQFSATLIELLPEHAAIARDRTIVRSFYDFGESLAPAIITNPPYDQINARDGRGRWLRHTLDMPGWRYCALLLSWDWPAARQNGLGALLDAHPFSYCYLLRWKLDFTGAGSPPQRNAWFVWVKGWTGEPAFRWLDRVDVRQGVLL